MTEIEKQILIDCLERRRKELDIKPVKQPQTLATVIGLIGRVKAMAARDPLNPPKNHRLTTKQAATKPQPIAIETNVTCGTTVKEALAQADRIYEMCETVAGYDRDDAWEFANGVKEQTEGIAKTIEERWDVTENQQIALDNMESGISAWIR